MHRSLTQTTPQVARCASQDTIAGEPQDDDDSEANAGWGGRKPPTGRELSSLLIDPRELEVPPPLNTPPRPACPPLPPRRTLRRCRRGGATLEAATKRAAAISAHVRRLRCPWGSSRFSPQRLHLYAAVRDARAKRARAWRNSSHPQERPRPTPQGPRRRRIHPRIHPSIHPPATHSVAAGSTTTYLPTPRPTLHPIDPLVSLSIQNRFTSICLSCCHSSVY